MNINDVVAAAKIAGIEVQPDKHFVWIYAKLPNSLFGTRIALAKNVRPSKKRNMRWRLWDSGRAPDANRLRDAVHNKTKARATLAVVTWIIEQREKRK